MSPRRFYTVFFIEQQLRLKGSMTKAFRVVITLLEYRKTSRQTKHLLKMNRRLAFVILIE